MQETGQMIQLQQKSLRPKVCTEVERFWNPGCIGQRPGTLTSFWNSATGTGCCLDEIET